MIRQTITTKDQQVEQLAYSVHEAAKVLGITEGSLRLRIARGAIPVTRWGHRVFVLRDDIVRILGERIA